MAKLYAAQQAPQLRQGFFQAMRISDGEGNGECSCKLASIRECGDMIFQYEGNGFD
ncbi:MAG: hypothetical protein PHW43_06330 [Syntrophales bacterium]|nr:hypothetical protein [Syntrophales bacterium]